MNPEELSKELDRLWAKVAPTTSPLEGPLFPPRSLGIDPDAPAREASLEAVHLLKRQHREQAAQWQQMLDSKDEAIRTLTERLRTAQAELAEMRKSVGMAEQRVMSEMYDVASKMEASHQALKAQEEAFRKEETILRELLDKTRQQLTAETNRWRDLERAWNEREQEYLSDLHDMQARLSKEREASDGAKSTSRQQAESLQEAKRAVEATLAELLAERRLKDESNQDRQKALQRVGELTEHLASLQKTWDEERRQWQELWDRERSTWEVQRQEFSGWEERLRREREEWHKDLQKKEQDVLRFSSEMTETLRQSTETGSKLNALLKSVSESTRGIQGPYIPVRWRPRIAALLVIAGLAAAGNFGWRAYNKPRFVLGYAHALPQPNPTSAAYDGSVLWIAEWSGRLSAVDPANPSVIIAKYDPQLPTAYHPISIVFGGGYLWSLDASQGRIVKHSPTDPSHVQGAWSTPGPAPTALAFDGKDLWSYDAVNKALYRHSGEGASGQVEAYRPNVDMVPTSMAWIGDELWVHDSKGRRILRFRLDQKALQLIDALEFDQSAQSFTAYRTTDGAQTRRFVWSLDGALPAPSPSPFTLKEYQVQP